MAMPTLRLHTHTYGSLMAHSTEKCHLVTLLDKLVNNSGDSDDEESLSLSFNAESTGNNSNCYAP
jgi:hypothetical protein